MFFPKGKNLKHILLKLLNCIKNATFPAMISCLRNRLKESAAKIFKAFKGVGYARLDFRVNDKNQIFFLEINFTCSVFYEKGYEGSADYILMNEPSEDKEAFLHKIIRKEFTAIRKNKRNIL